MADARRAAPILEVRGLDVYYGRSHALQGVDLTLDSGVLSVVGRNGMGKTTLCKTIMGLVRATGGSVRVRRRGPVVAATGADRPARRRLRTAGTTSVAFAHRRRAFAHDRGHAPWRVDGRAHLRHIPAPRRAQEQWRRPALRRRAADAGDLARAGHQSAPPDHGRADRRACPRHRRAGRGDAGAAGRGRRHFGARHRAEYRGGDGGRQQRRHHGQRPRQSRHRFRAPGCRSRPATAPARRRTSFRSRGRGQSGGSRTRRAERRLPRARRACAPIRIYISNPAPPTRWSQPVPIARIESGARALSTGVLETRGGRAAATRHGSGAKLRTADRACRRHAGYQGRGTQIHPRHRRRQRIARAPRRCLDGRQGCILRRLRAGNSA